MAGQIITETPVAGYIAPVFEIVGDGRRRAPGRLGAPQPLHPTTGATIFQLPPRAAWSPAVNVFDTGESFVIIAELAGVGPDSLRIELDGENKRITLRGTRVGSAPSLVADFDAMDEEIASGRFERVVPLGEPVDVRGARAVCRYGLLELMLPKLGTREPKRAPLRPAAKRRAVAC